MGRKSFIAILTTLALIVTGTSLALAAEPNFGGDNQFTSGDVCGGAQEVHLVDLQVNEDGWRILTVTGPHHQGFYRVDASGNAVTGELDTILPAGTYLVAPDVLGTGWTYGAGCDPTNMVLDHIALQVADPSVDSQGMLVLPDEYPQVYDLFVPEDGMPMASGVDLGSTTDTVVMDPEPVEQSSSGNFWDDMDTTSDPVVQETGSVVAQTTFVEATLEDPFNQNGDTETATLTPVLDQQSLSELCKNDDAAAQLASLTGLSLAASRDVCNAQADETQWCGAHQDYDLQGHPELATAASFIVPHFEPFNGNGDLVTIIPHGRYRMAREKGFPGHAWEFGVNCTYDQVYAMTQLYLQSQGLSPDVFQVYNDPREFTNYFSMITYQGDYRGGNEDPERDSPVCRMAKKKFLLENLGGVIARNDNRFPDRWNGYVSMQPWKSGTPEYETWEYIPDGKALVYDDSTIGGSVWLAYGNCSDQWMRGNAKQSHNSRVLQYAENEDISRTAAEQHFDLVPNLEGKNSPIKSWFQLR